MAAVSPQAIKASGMQKIPKKSDTGNNPLEGMIPLTSSMKQNTTNASSEPTGTKQACRRDRPLLRIRCVAEVGAIPMAPINMSPPIPPSGSRG